VCHLLPVAGTATRACPRSRGRQTSSGARAYAVPSAVVSVAVPPPSRAEDPALRAVDLRHPRDASEAALAALISVPRLATELGELFAAAGHELHLVGGPVRDLVLGRGASDLDLTTDATPDEVLALTKDWREGVWEMGVDFGTVGLVKGGQRVEVTTFRTESYDGGSRNPHVRFGTSLLEDLRRRDFTVNAMAVSVPGHVFVDPTGGLGDLAAGLLRTPARPEESFGDDPLRMLRGVRFTATLGFRLAEEALAATRDMAPRLAIVSPERVRDELVKTLMAPDPVPALDLLVSTGLAGVVLPELPRLRMSIDPLHQHKDVYAHSLAVLRNAVRREVVLGGPDLVLRLAALVHDIGKPDTRRAEPGGGVSFHHHEVVGASMARRRLAALRFPKAVVADVATLVALHLRFHGYGVGAGAGGSPWTDSAVRRYVTDAGPLLERLHVLVRSDCTTRNVRKARALDAAYEALEARIASLREKEELALTSRPDLDGSAVMRLLGVPAGPVIGRALAHLRECKLEHGPLGEERATAELLAWARAQGIDPPG